MARARELEAEEEERLRESSGPEEIARELYNDSGDDARLRNTDSADDISLFETEPEAGVYRDEFTDEEDNVFSHGDDDDERNIGIAGRQAQKGGR